MKMTKKYYMETGSTDPFFNLAMEQYVFDHLGDGDSCFMLWQNDNAVIIGKYQNTYAEINAEYVREHKIRVARRLSGGGAVYHDLGNLNFTFISEEDGDHFDFTTYCRVIISALQKFGVNAEITGRNDMTVEGKKFSGNSQYYKRGRIMHHGTILFDSDLTVLSKALKVKPDKYRSKGMKSVRSRVTNLKPYLPQYDTIDTFWAALRDELIEKFDAVPYAPSKSELEEIQSLRDSFYSTWEWNYGFTPDYSVFKERYVENCGTIQIYMDAVRGGSIQDIRFYGDFFAGTDPSILSETLKGCRLDQESLQERLSETNIDLFFKNLSKETFIQLILE